MLLLCVITFLPVPALAAGMTYTLEELDAEITAPEGGFYIFLRNMEPTAPVLSNIGLTAEELGRTLEEGNIYLDALCYDGSYEFTVQMLTGEDYASIFDCALIDQKDWGDVIEGARSGLEDLGYSVGRLERYESGAVSYLYGELASEGEVSWLCQYQTIHNGKLISINAVSSSLDRPTQEIRDQLKAMADSLYFTYDAPVPQEVLDAYKEDLGWKEIFERAAAAAVIGGILGGGAELLIKRIKS